MWKTRGDQGPWSGVFWFRIKRPIIQILGTAAAGVLKCGFRAAKSKACGKARGGFPPAGQGVWTQRATGVVPCGKDGGPRAFHGESSSPCWVALEHA